MILNRQNKGQPLWVPEMICRDCQVAWSPQVTLLCWICNQQGDII